MCRQEQRHDGYDVVPALLASSGPGLRFLGHPGRFGGRAGGRVLPVPDLVSMAARARAMASAARACPRHQPMAAPMPHPMMRMMTAIWSPHPAPGLRAVSGEMPQVNMQGGLLRPDCGGVG